MTRSRWYMVGAVVAGSFLAIGLITGTMPMRRSLASFALDTVGFALGAATWGLICFGCIYGAVKNR